MSDGVQPCTHALGALTLQNTANTNVGEEEIDRYDPGDSNPYTHEYIFKHEPFRYLPDSYFPDDGFTPPTLVFGIGLLRHEAVAYAEDYGFLAPSESKYIAPRLFRAYRAMASHFSQLYGRKIQAVTVLSRKCHIVFTLFDSYSRPEDREGRLEMRDILRKMVEIFPDALERYGYFYWAMNESMYPPGYSRLMYKQ